mgnify:FL=1
MRGMELKNEIEEARNYIFYVSDYIDVSAGHAWKMDCRQAMTEQMVQNLPNCKVMKYTEYHGECLDADSVGILFPSKMWGISLAVYAFLQNLRVSASTYVYAVAMGEVLSAEVNGTANVRMETLGQFQDLFERRRLGDISDIYIRCIDYKREFTTTEEKLMRSVTTAERIADVMEGLLFYSMKAVKEQKLQFVTDKRTTVRTKHVAERKEVTALVETKILPMPNIKNVFLDDDLLSEVRICQAM